jgi:hypothetical protein
MLPVLRPARNVLGLRASCKCDVACRAHCKVSRNLEDPYIAGTA